MSKLVFDMKKILEYQQNRSPYLMIDFAEEIIPGASSKGFKDLKEDERFFKVHWEKDPNMPGMLQVEALVQMSSLAILSLPGNKGKVMYLTSANKLKFYKKILPGSRLYLDTKVISFKRGIASCKGIGVVEGNKVSEAEFNLILPDEINKLQPNSTKK